MAGIAAQRSDIGRLDRVRLRYGWGFEKSDFECYGLAGSRPGHDPTNYLGYRWYRYKVRPALNTKWARSITEDKWIFYRLIDSFGLPAPQTYGLYDPAYGTTWDLARPLRTADDLVEELARLRPPAVVLKPNGGHQGQNLLILDRIDHDSGRAVTGAGEDTAVEEALRSVDITGMGGYPGYIVQERLANHPALAELAPYATNTVRVQTLLSEMGEVHVLGAVLRLSRRGKMVDNFSQGGVAVAVDPETGVTGRGITKHSDFISRHPDSGVDLAGRQLPFWDEVLSLVRRGAGCLTGLRGVGWDVAVTPTGPVVVEANNNWDLQVLQTHTDGYLADPIFRRWMADVGAPLPSGNVLQGLVGRWLWPVIARIRNN
jgi:Sugar-transfer associated ATP-grasp